MKLAEALQERADLNRRIQQLQQRLGNNAMVQGGSIPLRIPKSFWWSWIALSVSWRI